MDKPNGKPAAALWHKLAIACGLLPMILGTAIFVAWLITDSDVLEIIGLLLVYGGVALLALGLVCLLAFVSRARKAGIAYRRARNWALVVLFLNFPLCAATIFLAFAMESANVVTLVNNAAVPIEAMILSDPQGRQFHVGSIQPGQDHQACFGFAGEGAVRFSFNAQGTPHAGILIGYLAGPLGSRATLTLSRDMTVETDEQFHRISLTEYLRSCVPG